MLISLALIRDELNRRKFLMGVDLPTPTLVYIAPRRSFGQLSLFASVPPPPPVSPQQKRVSLLFFANVHMINTLLSTEMTKRQREDEENAPETAFEAAKSFLDVEAVEAGEEEEEENMSEIEG